MPHRALAIDEILREVAAHATDIHPPTTVALACCSRSFEEPALSTLWRIQKRLPFLITTLPRNSWKFRIVGTDRPEDIIVCGFLIRPCPALFENSQLTRDCDVPVLGVDVHSSPVER